MGASQTQGRAGYKLNALGVEVLARQKPIEVRRIDDIGRITIPLYWRNALGLEGGTEIDLVLDERNGGSILLKRSVPQIRCCVCDSEVSDVTGKKILALDGRYICRKCATTIANTWRERTMTKREYYSVEALEARVRARRASELTFESEGGRKG